MHVAWKKNNNDSFSLPRESLTAGLPRRLFYIGRLEILISANSVEPVKDVVPVLSHAGVRIISTEVAVEAFFVIANFLSFHVDSGNSLIYVFDSDVPDESNSRAIIAAVVAVPVLT